MGLLSSEGGKTLQLVVRLGLGTTMCFFGSVWNLVNIFVFWKQGLRKTINISMFAIAVSDLGSLVTLAWVNINLNPLMEHNAIPFEPFNIASLTGNLSHSCFLQITIWITVHVTAERFVCIALPLKVKQIFTPLRTKVTISLIYFLIFLTVVPPLIYFEFGETFIPERNETRVGLKVRDITRDLDELTFITYLALEITSCVALTVVTCLLVVALKRRIKWRKTFSAGGDQCQVPSRSGTRTMKMVGLIAGVLIVCAAPAAVISSAQISVYYFSYGDRHSELFHGLWSFAHFTEAVPPTVNTVLFYKMSSKYKKHFDNILSRCRACCHGFKTRNQGAV